MKVILIIGITVFCSALSFAADISPCTTNYDQSITCPYPSVKIGDSWYHVIEDEDSAQGFCVLRGMSFVNWQKSWATQIYYTSLNRDGSVGQYDHIVVNDGLVVDYLANLTCRLTLDIENVGLNSKELTFTVHNQATTDTLSLALKLRKVSGFHKDLFDGGVNLSEAAELTSIGNLVKVTIHLDKLKMQDGVKVGGVYEISLNAKLIGQKDNLESSDREKLKVTQ